jgi:hypothetical protein
MEGAPLMTRSKIGDFVGSLSSTSINRKLTQALIALAPEDLAAREARSWCSLWPCRSTARWLRVRRDLDRRPPALQPGLRPGQTGRGGRAEGGDRCRRHHPAGDAGIQAVDPGHAQERDRLGLKAVVAELLRSHASGFDRRVSRIDRHRTEITEPAVGELLRRAADDRTRGLHPAHTGEVRAYWRGHRRLNRVVPAGFHAGVLRLRRAGPDCASPFVTQDFAGQVRATPTTTSGRSR